MKVKPFGEKLIEVDIRGRIEIYSTPIQRALEERLKSYGLSFQKVSYMTGSRFGGGGIYDIDKVDKGGVYHFGEGADDVYLVECETSKKEPYLKYSRRLCGDVATINQFVCKYNDYRRQTEEIGIMKNSRNCEQLDAFFYGGKLAMILMDDNAEFSIPFMQDAFSNYFKTTTKPPTDWSFYDYCYNDGGTEGFIIERIEKEKRARSPPNTPKLEFQSEVLNRDLVYMLVDEFVRRYHKSRTNSF